MSVKRKTALIANDANATKPARSGRIAKSSLAGAEPVPSTPLQMQHTLSQAFAGDHLQRPAFGSGEASDKYPLKWTLIGLGLVCGAFWIAVTALLV